MVIKSWTLKFMLILFCLFQEYNVRACSSNDKNYFIGRFVTGLPSFSKKQSAENKWSIQKEGLQGRQVTDALRVVISNFFQTCSYACGSVSFLLSVLYLLI